MIIETRMICPKSWKCLFLLSEYNICFNQKNITLNDEIKFDINTPKIDEKDDLAYIFSNLQKFVSMNKDQLEHFGNLMNQIECHFIPNIILPIRFERVIKPLVHRTAFNIENLKNLREKLMNTLVKYSEQLQFFDWFEKEKFGYWDITISTAIAVLDYLGEINWKSNELKSLYYWYLKIKSRNSFQIVLNQTCPGLKPFFNFKNIDF